MKNKIALLLATGLLAIGVLSTALYAPPAEVETPTRYRLMGLVNCDGNQVDPTTSSGGAYDPNIRDYVARTASAAETSAVLDANNAETLRLIRAVCAALGVDANTHSLAALAAIQDVRTDANTHSLALLEAMSTGLPSAYAVLEIGDGNTNGTAMLTTTAACSVLEIGMAVDGNAAMVSFDNGATWNFFLQYG
ncbi:MAG TPA: hypothetical protein VMW52_09305, partial [Phycisphaerae bacterium]|nr:hypothetical protein [Phycisphaerae bacterium]